MRRFAGMNACLASPTVQTLKASLLKWAVAAGRNSSLGLEVPPGLQTLCCAKHQLNPL